MKYSYPLLKKVTRYFKNNSASVSDYYLVCCQHILEPQLKMFESLIDFGFDPKKIILLGKIYSTNKDIQNEIRKKGIKVFQPEFSGESFDFEHRKNCIMILNLVPKEAKIIILDEGAELIQSFSDDKRDIVFAIEQTSSGFRRLANHQFNFPIINVARSNIKLIYESPHIAQLGFKRIKNYLGKSLSKPVIFVIGLGPIGTSFLEIFKKHHYTVYGFDIKYGHNDLLRSINSIKPDIIIGATGFPILQKEDINNIFSDKHLYLISVSSSDREFPVWSFRKDNKTHADVVHKNLIFLNNGFPLTFMGNRYEVEPKWIERTICLLYGSIIYGVITKIKEKGLINVPKELEDLLN